MQKNTKEKLKKWVVRLWQAVLFVEAAIILFKFFFLGITSLKALSKHWIWMWVAVAFLWIMKQDNPKFWEKMYKKYGSMCPECGSRIIGISCSECDFIVPKEDTEKR